MLAVVSVKNKYANQIVAKISQDVDLKGVRSLGVHQAGYANMGSESEKAFLELAETSTLSTRLACSQEHRWAQ